jgi:hypothetical protein
MCRLTVLLHLHVPVTTRRATLLSVLGAAWRLVGAAAAFEKDGAAFDCLLSPKPDDEYRVCVLGLPGSPANCAPGQTFSMAVGLQGQCLDAPCTYSCTFQ